MNILLKAIFQIWGILAFITFLFVIVSYSACQDLDSQTFYEVEKKIKAQIPDSVFIGEGSASAILKNGEFYFVDNSSNVIHHFDENGKLVKTFGRKGRGPGEFYEVNDIFISNDILYLLDYKNARIQLWDLKTDTFIKSININISFFINSELAVFNDEILVLGSMPKNDLFIHRFDMEGNYRGSFGQFINFSEFMMNTNGKLQLTQLHASTSEDKYILFTIAAPYRMFYYNDKYELLWKYEDKILPKPWLDHIKVTPTSYTASFYPMTFNSVFVDNKTVMIYWLDPENEKSYYDLRNRNNGELINRSEFNFNFATIALTIGEGKKIWVLTSNRENLDLTLYRLKAK